jgi:hypothetical protein
LLLGSSFFLKGKKWISPRTLAKMADVFDIEAFELLRPENSIPDDSINIIEPVPKLG